MNLYDPQRPTLGGQQLFLNNHTAIKDLAFWPNQDGTLEVAAWLPLKFNSDHPRGPFSFMEFVNTISRDEVQNLIDEFISDPEALFERLFDNPESQFRPELRTKLDALGALEDKEKYPQPHGAKKQEPKSPRREPQQAVFNLLDDDDAIIIEPSAKEPILDLDL